MLPQTSSIIAQKQERGRLARISRWTARSAKLAGAAAVIGRSSPPVEANKPNPTHPFLVGNNNVTHRPDLLLCHIARR